MTFFGCFSACRPLRNQAHVMSCDVREEKGSSPTLAASFLASAFLPNSSARSPPLAFRFPPRSTMHRWKCDKCRLPYLFHSVQWSLVESTPTAGRKPSAQETRICCAKETMVTLKAFGFPDGLSAQWTIQTRRVGIRAAVGGNKRHIHEI